MSRDVLNLGADKTHRGFLTLVRDMAMATQIAKCAAALHVPVRNFDDVERLMTQAKSEKPFLVILDLEKCEAEAFRMLNEWHKNADLKSIPVIGFVTQAKAMVKPEAEKAGCFRVYMKTEFGRELPNLISRYAV